MYWNPVILIKSAAIQYHVKLHLELVDSESLMPQRNSVWPYLWYMIKSLFILIPNNKIIFYLYIKHFESLIKITNFIIVNAEWPLPKMKKEKKRKMKYIVFALYP